MNAPRDSDECPCESGKAFGDCCKGIVDWSPESLRGEAYVRNLSIRGKNLLFLGDLFSALQIDRPRGLESWARVKRACSDRAVREIHESILELWPDEADLTRAYSREGELGTALYVGTYEPDALLRGITRHCLYADKMLIFDPFIHALRSRPEYNPIENPQEFRIDTIRCALLWVALSPWIEAGLVQVIRSPGDFDVQLQLDSFEVERQRYESSSELKRLFEEEVKEKLKSGLTDHDDYRRLGTPNAVLARAMLECNPNATEEDIQGLIAYFDRRRAEHRYFIEEPGGSGRPLNNQYIRWTSGANYEISKIVAGLTGSHLVTDIRARWYELTLDTDNDALKSDPWQPFAKAFSGIGLKCLEGVSLGDALSLRQDGRLSSMRSFLRRVWEAARSDDAFDESSIATLTEELRAEISGAESEWDRISREMRLRLGLQVAGTPPSAPGAVAAGYGELYAAGWLAAVAVNVGNAWHQRRSFAKRSPSAFFLSLERRSGNASGAKAAKKITES